MIEIQIEYFLIIIPSFFQMEELREVFSFPLEKMKALSAYMKTQMTEGLCGRESDLKMLPSFVTSLATGTYVRTR